jgi:hypothetical protein
VLIADATGIAFLVINYRRHGFTPCVVFRFRVQGSEVQGSDASAFSAVI